MISTDMSVKAKASNNLFVTTLAVGQWQSAEIVENFVVADNMMGWANVSSDHRVTLSSLPSFDHFINFQSVVMFIPPLQQTEPNTSSNYLHISATWFVVGGLVVGGLCLIFCCAIVIQFRKRKSKVDTMGYSKVEGIN